METKINITHRSREINLDVLLVIITMMDGRENKELDVLKLNVLVEEVLLSWI